MPINEIWRCPHNGSATFQRLESPLFRGLFAARFGLRPDTGTLPKSPGRNKIEPLALVCERLGVVNIPLPRAPSRATSFYRWCDWIIEPICQGVNGGNCQRIGKRIGGGPIRLRVGVLRSHPLEAGGTETLRRPGPPARGQTRVGQRST